MGSGLISSIVGLSLVLLTSYFYCFIGNSKYLHKRIKLWGIVAFTYILSALIFSLSFNGTTCFIIHDPMNYIYQFGDIRSLPLSEAMEMLLFCYIDIGDNNALFNIILKWIIVAGNSCFDGINSFYLSLLSVLFGLLSSITLFRILSNNFKIEKAYKYTLLFSLLSLYHFYSVVIIRDICIALFYLMSYEIVQKKFSVKGLFLLIIYMLLSWGLRLYSGLFLILLIIYYIYIPITKSKFKYVILPIFGGLLLFVIGSSMYIIDQTIEEIELYQDFTKEGASSDGGFINKLLSLPKGVKEIVLVFYSQITPMPPYLHLLKAETFSHIYMATMVIVYEVYWYLIAYTFFYVLFIKKYYRKLEFKDILMLLIVLAFIVANTSHPDIRRMMPVYPIIYYYYLRMRETTFNLKWYKQTQKNLMAIYFCLIFVYIILKG